MISGAEARLAEFDARCMNASGGACDADCLAQERGLALIRFDQVERHSGGEGQDQARKACTGAEIDGAIRAREHQRGELQRIGDVAIPKQRLISRRHQVDRSVPAEQQRGEALEGSSVFHVKHVVRELCFT